jgi:hypothetical protein
MKEFDLKKECEKETFDYDSHWESDEEEDANKKVTRFSKGNPRKGIKGKYLKVKNKITKGQIKYSYSNGLKKIKDDAN